MSDIISLLPDSVANQIAAGEVIQRPASAVKELLENAIDASSIDIKLIVKDAGKTLIQIVDNGTGMSETDARMCFERHATSKIKNADDLFRITTMGFRGEALASVAAIAQVEVKTKLRAQGDDEPGTQIEIEASKVKNHSLCQCSRGTNISVKNLFFNVPARRNFLKSDSVELRHIIEEFQRAALAHPEIAFSFHHNNSELFHLPQGTLRQRIVGIFGESYNHRLVPVSEETAIAGLTGFICKPQFARKTRGEQFFFVNKRFIRSAYLHHAVQNAYENLLPDDAFPSYFILLGISPENIDVNIHPTKTEIKFEDERAVYTILRAAVKQSLGKYNIAPSLDFEQETAIALPLTKPSEDALLHPPKININPHYNPFEAETKRESPSLPIVIGTPNWGGERKKAYIDSPVIEESEAEQPQEITFHMGGEGGGLSAKPAAYQLHNKFILAHIKTGMIVIDQQAAHQRILFENYCEKMEKQKGISQQQLFPQTIEFPAEDALIVKELQPELNALGFELHEFGKNTFIIHGLPADISDKNIFEFLEKLIEDHKVSRGVKSEIFATKKERVAHTLAKNFSVKAGEPLTREEMNRMVDELFACKMPYASPSGKPTLITIPLEEIEKKFKK